MRFGMDDGYFVGPRAMVFQVLAEFARGVREETGCELVSHKCKIYSLDENAWDDCQRNRLIPEDLSEIQECIFVNEEGERLRGVTIYNLTSP